VTTVCAWVSTRDRSTRGGARPRARDARRGNHGTAVSGTARILDGDGLEPARRVIALKYGLIGQMTTFSSVLGRLRGGGNRAGGVAVTPDD
jgi:hypothetical protein